MASQRQVSDPKVRVYLDLTHIGRHVTGIERIAIEQFEKIQFDDAEIIAVRARGLISMIVRQQLLLPLLALWHPTSKFIFPGFPPSPLFALMRERVTMYVHDTFLMTRRSDLSFKARIYMAPMFAIAVRRLKNFFVNSEKTRTDLLQHAAADASILLYRPSVANHFALDNSSRGIHRSEAVPLKLVSLGTVEPRKNYQAAVRILEEIRFELDPAAQLHIIGRAGWGDVGAQIAAHPNVVVHGYLSPADVKRVLSDADIYLCTSHDEGLGLPLLEAQFAGLPVVAPEQPVFREVLGQSGTFIDPQNAAAGARAIMDLLTQPEWRSIWSAKSCANIRRWNEAAALDLAAAKQIFASIPSHDGHLACPAASHT